MRIQGLALLLGTGLLVSSCSRDGSTVAPPRDDTPVNVAERPSTIAVPISLSLMALQERLNSEVPRRLFAIDEARNACVPAQYSQVCVGIRIGGVCRGQETQVRVTPDIPCHIRGVVNRGPLQLGGAGNTINLSMPVGVAAEVSGVGAVGSNLQQTVTGSADIAAAVRPAIAPDWTPRVGLELDYDWRNRIGIDLLGRRIALSSAVDPQIQAALQRVSTEAGNALSNLQLRQQMQQVWAALGQPVQLSADPQSWFRFTPQRVGYSGLQVANGQASTTITIGGTSATLLGSQPSGANPTPLPPLQQAPAPGGFRVFVPVMVDYGAMETAVEQALNVGQEQVFDIPVLGKTNVTFQNVELYQTTGRNLAIGITLDMKNQRDWRGLSGTVWLTARPVFDENSRVLGIDQMRVAADTNSWGADQLIRVINFGPLNQLIRSAVRYDFTDGWRRALGQLNAALNRDLGNGIRMRGNITNASVADNSTGAGGYYLGLEAEGAVQVDLDTNALQFR